ncbi:LysE family transporter [Halobacteria archaeon AArc-m2/3/4]|uniref:LysE family transporter n=1 Tax=Natronoglomus mannanivorans TaxID=2979990 RepID=A0AAP2YZ45_9EURY|nr:LysE family transporter [Halobacteria archaeon AArc-xg1-1]MCU4973323.1 LysE family transporter [Halobacteria archaeon AArc-m2/3/4]
MLSSLTTLTVGVVFGLALAAPPGPMNAVIAEESVNRGWTAGFRTGVGAMLADVVFFGLTVLGVATIVSRYATLESALFLVGGLLMLLFAADAVGEATGSSFTSGSVADTATGFQKAFALSLTNPYQLTFWLTAGVGLVRPGTLVVTDHAPALERAVGSLAVETGSPALLLGFFGGIVIWIVAYPATLVTVGRRIDAFAPAVAVASGLVLAGFGLLFCWLGLTGFL